MASTETDLEGIGWRGVSMDEIYQNLNPWDFQHFPPISHSREHTVLFHLPVSTERTEPPQPYRTDSKWDPRYVRLPCSEKNQYPQMKEDGTEYIESRWNMIENALLRPLLSSHQLEAAILSYNRKFSQTWKFRGLHKLFNEVLDPEESASFFQHTLPDIIGLALRLPELVCGAIPLLKQEKNHAISLTQQQIASLLANAFLCTFPRRNKLNKKTVESDEYRTFPDINFNRLFLSTEIASMEKVKCICNYFRRVCGSMPLGTITVYRRSIPFDNLPDWTNCVRDFQSTRIHVSESGTIEDAPGLLQVDFANKYLGGGVLGRGCVQEEIRFVICPELLITRLFTEYLKPNEAVFIVGCERFNEYTGYASEFQWDGDHIDDTRMDDSGRRICCIVAIDALNFRHANDQYREDLMKRELNKAYIGFLPSIKTVIPAVASGNWGCGAFGGDKSLKSLLQLIACTMNDRSLVYYTFGDKKFCDELNDMHTFLCSEKITVSLLWKYLNEYRRYKSPSITLFQFIYQYHLDRDSLSIPPVQQVEAIATTSKVRPITTSKIRPITTYFKRKRSDESRSRTDERKQTDILDFLNEDGDDKLTALSIDGVPSDIPIETTGSHLIGTDDIRSNVEPTSTPGFKMNKCDMQMGIDEPTDVITDVNKPEVENPAKEKFNQKSLFDYFDKF